MLTKIPLIAIFTGLLLGSATAQAAHNCGTLIDSHASAERFVSEWAANWNRLDIDAVVAHLADDSSMRSPFATELTGSALVQGRDAIRGYWHKAYGALAAPNLQVETFSWDPAICRLNIWWTADTRSGATRASEYMDFNADGKVISGEAFYSH